MLEREMNHPEAFCPGCSQSSEGTNANPASRDTGHVARARCVCVRERERERERERDGILVGLPEERVIPVGLEC